MHLRRSSNWASVRAAFGGSAKQTPEVLHLSPGKQGTHNKHNTAESPISGQLSQIHWNHHSCCKAAEQELTCHLCFSSWLEQFFKMQENSVESLTVCVGRFRFVCSPWRAAELPALRQAFGAWKRSGLLTSTLFVVVHLLPHLPCVCVPIPASS